MYHTNHSCDFNLRYRPDDAIIMLEESAVSNVFQYNFHKKVTFITFSTEWRRPQLPYVLDSFGLKRWLRYDALFSRGLNSYENFSLDLKNQTTKGFSFEERTLIFNQEFIMLIINLTSKSVLTTNEIPQYLPCYNANSLAWPTLTWECILFLINACYDSKDNV